MVAESSFKSKTTRKTCAYQPVSQIKCHVSNQVPGYLVGMWDCSLTIKCKATLGSSRLKSNTVTAVFTRRYDRHFHHGGLLVLEDFQEIARRADLYDAEHAKDGDAIYIGSNDR